MPIISSFSGNLIPISRSVIFPPPKATVVRSSTGVFQITNYKSMFLYTLTVTNGTISNPDSSGYFNMSSANAICTITPSFGLNGPSTLVERKSYTYSCRTVPQTCYQGCNCSVTCNGGCSTNSACGGYQQCGCPTWYCGTVDVVCQSCPYDCSYTACDVLIDQSGNGYTNSGTEWYKVS